MEDMNDRRDQNEGGLFSDDYAPQKRENPYLKKKKPVDQATGEKESAGKPRWDNPYVKREKWPKLPSNAPTEASRVSHVPRPSLKDRFDNFMFTHVKLIVFLISVFVVVMLLGPFSVFRISEWVEEARIEEEMATKDKLTLMYVRGLCDKAEPITWDDFTRFYHDDRSSKNMAIWVITVEGGYEVWVGGQSTATLPDYVVMYDSDNGDKVDLTDGLMALEKFLDERD